METVSGGTFGMEFVLSFLITYAFCAARDTSLSGRNYYPTAATATTATTAPSTGFSSLFGGAGQTGVASRWTSAFGGTATGAATMTGSTYNK